jgi:hypothetical protein
MPMTTAVILQRNVLIRISLTKGNLDVETTVFHFAVEINTIKQTIVHCRHPSFLLRTMIYGRISLVISRLWKKVATRGNPNVTLIAKRTSPG